MIDEFELMFQLPKLAPPAEFKITSPQSRAYNCIAWAAGESHRWWWPDKMRTHYWPKEVPCEPTLVAFVAAYRLLGYEPCDGGNLEPGFEKIAIFVRPSGTPGHAARQLANGKWTSKLGPLQDIEHDLEGVECNSYGVVRQFLKRRLR